MKLRQMVNLGFGAVAIFAMLAVATKQNGSSPPLPAIEFSGVVRHVVDGDSMFVTGHGPQVRLWGVDAPERDDQGYAEATDTLMQIAHGNRVTCQQQDRDRYNRTVARCFLADGRDVNLLMIESGTASEYLRFSRGFYSGG